MALPIVPILLIAGVAMLAGGAGKKASQASSTPTPHPPSSRALAGRRKLALEEALALAELKFPAPKGKIVVVPVV